MQPINIFNSQDVKVTIDENGTPVDVYVNGGLATSVLFYADYASLPAQGEGGILYITEDTNYLYRWDGSYIQVGGGSLTWGQITGTLSNQTDLQNALDDKVPYTGATGNINIGVYNIVANDGTSDSEFAPNFVGVENASGYTVIDPTGLYTADGSGQMEVNPQGLIFPDSSVQTTAGISGVDWGDIQGTLSYQTDLQTALDGKVDENSAITGATKTKITYDSKGLVTSGADAGISDITGLQTALDGKVPYTGATGNVNLGEYGVSGGYYQFDTTPTTYTQAVGNVGWNDTEGTIETLLKGGNVVLEIGQKLVSRVVNGTGGNVLRSNYQVVKVTGAQGQRLQVNLAQGNNDANSADTLGLIAENISNNQSGFIVTSGIISEINTTGSLQSETWADGDPLYLSPTTAGKVTNVKPQAPNHTVIVGFVVYAHANHGKIFVKIDNGYELDELHNVKINTPLNGQVLRYNGTTFVWENSNDSDNLTFNAPLSRSVNAISISQSSASANGYLSSTDWSTFNSKEPALTKGNLTESTSSVLTISGGSSAVIGSGTTIQVKQASSTQSGFLSSTDWNTFNGKQNALTNPVTGTGTNNEIAYFNTTGSTIGSLSTATYPSLTELSYVKGVTSAIQTQLNGKQATLTNPITGTGTSGQVAYFNGTTTQTGSSNLFWDATNNRLGIGITTPSYSIEIKSSSPFISFNTTGTFAGFRLQQNGIDRYTCALNGQANQVYSRFNSSGVYVADTLTLYSTGNVGVNTTSDAGYGIDINGTARVQNNITINGTATISDNISVSKNQNSFTKIEISNTTSGTSSASFFRAISDTGSGNFDFGKLSSTYTAYKILASKDTYISNFTAGDISILNDFATGKIKLAAGGSSTAQATLFSTGNLAIGTTTDSGYKLDVNGTARVQGNLTTNLTAGSIPFIGASGLLSQSNSNLFWDDTNKRLGIGTSSPSSTFEVIAGSDANGIKLRGRSSDNISNIFFSSNSGTQYGYFQHRSTVFRVVNNVGDIEFWNGPNTGSTSQKATLFTSGNFAIGNTSDAGYILDASGTVRIGGNLTISDSINIILGTTTGTKIGTATSQKIGFWNATPIVQPTTAVAASTLVSNLGTPLTDTDTFDGYTLKQIVKALRNTGILA